jgi:hypothetical protein
VIRRQKINLRRLFATVRVIGIGRPPRHDGALTKFTCLRHHYFAAEVHHQASKKKKRPASKSIELLNFGIHSMDTSFCNISDQLQSGS